MERVLIINEIAPDTRRIELLQQGRFKRIHMVDLNDRRSLNLLGILGSGLPLQVGAYRGESDDPFVLLRNYGTHPIDIRMDIVNLPDTVNQSDGWRKVGADSSLGVWIRDNPLSINFPSGTLVVKCVDSL